MAVFSTLSGPQITQLVSPCQTQGYIFSRLYSNPEHFELLLTQPYTSTPRGQNVYLCVVSCILYRVYQKSLPSLKSHIQYIKDGGELLEHPVFTACANRKAPFFILLLFLSKATEPPRIRNADHSHA
jgi:hypothetical protein